MDAAQNAVTVPVAVRTTNQRRGTNSRTATACPAACFFTADLRSQSVAIKCPVIGCLVASHPVAIRLAVGRLSVGRPTTGRAPHRLTTGWS